MSDLLAKRIERARRPYFNPTGPAFLRPHSNNGAGAAGQFRQTSGALAKNRSPIDLPSDMMPPTEMDDGATDGPARLPSPSRGPQRKNGPALGHVVLIDDEEIDQMLYKRCLRRAGLTNRVTGFLSAERALDYLARIGQQNVDLILLDVNLPGMSGFDFLDALSPRLGANFNVPIVMMLTVALNPHDQDRAAQHSRVKAFIDKPLRPETLASTYQMMQKSSAA